MCVNLLDPNQIVKTKNMKKMKRKKTYMSLAKGRKKRSKYIAKPQVVDLKFDPFWFHFRRSKKLATIKTHQRTNKDK